MDAGRTDLHASIDTTGRTADRRADFEDVYGDWSMLRDRVLGDARCGPPRAATSRSALRAAERDPAGLSDAHAWR